MPRLVWSDNARRDLSRIRGFLAEKSLMLAQRAAKTIISGVKILGRDPKVGHPIEDLPASYREWVVEFGRGAYVVRYQLVGNDVVIMAIRHGREDGF